MTGKPIKVKEYPQHYDCPNCGTAMKQEAGIIIYTRRATVSQREIERLRDALSEIAGFRQGGIVQRQAHLMREKARIALTDSLTAREGADVGASEDGTLG